MAPESNLAQANELLGRFARSMQLNGDGPHAGELFAGVDLGTAYVVTALVDSSGCPAAGVITRSQASIRDGLVLDYMGAITILRQQVETLRRAGYRFTLATAAYPPGTEGRDAQAFANVLRAADLEVLGLVDEPSAAALVLGIDRGAVVDIGGGTTGLSVLANGEVVYTADEATGGIHLDLVIAGNFGIGVEEAERLKTDAARQRELFPLVRPVFQKMAAIVRHHLQGRTVDTVYWVGGTSCFPGIEEVIGTETGLQVVRPELPLLVTPLGIALSCLRLAGFAGA